MTQNAAEGRRAGGVLIVAAFFASELAALRMWPPTDATGMLAINAAAILLFTYLYGYTSGGIMLIFSLYVLVEWSMKNSFDIAYWAAGLAWILPFTFEYRREEREEETRRFHRFERERLEEERVEAERFFLETEQRLAAARKWRDRVAPLCNLAEDLLTTLRLKEVIVSLTRNIPELLPSMERLFCYRTESMGLEEARLMMVVPQEYASEVFTLDEIDRMCYQEGRPVLIEDVKKAGARVGKERTTGSLLLAPLVVRMRAEAGAAGIRHTLGALRVESSKANAFDRSDSEILNIISDIAARALHNADLYVETEHLAIRDGLTGLLLRQVFFERATQELSRSRRSGTAISFAMFDIDNFKKLNDTYGHTSGDLVLKRLAEMSQENLQPGEVVCRYGGEEICILMHNDVLRAEKRSSRFINNFAAEKFMLPDAEGNMQEVHVTLSGGVAAFPLHAEDLAGLIQQADRALYRAKRLGKNRVLTARRR